MNSFAYLQQLWTSAGGSGALSAIAAGIAMAENGALNPAARNYNTDGSYDIGLWQINTSHVGELIRAGIINSEADLMDPAKNAAAAVWVQQNGGGFKAWATYPWSGFYDGDGRFFDIMSTHAPDVLANLENVNGLPYTAQLPGQSAAQIPSVPQITDLSPTWKFSLAIVGTVTLLAVAMNAYGKA